MLGSEAIEQDHPLHEFFIDRYDRRRAMAHSILEAEIEAGRVRRDIDVDQLSIEIPATILGMEMQS